MSWSKGSTRKRHRIARSALGMAIAGALGLSGMMIVSPVHAQSSYGTLYGSAKPGDVVRITAQSTGRSQDVAVNANGQYVANGLSLGSYQVTLIEAGNTVGTKDAVVVAGSSIQVNFAATQNLAAVTVTAPSANAIDTKATAVRTVFTADQLKSLPIPRDVLAVAQLTPGTVQNSTFGAPSFGGSSSAENSYYIDGFNVTDMYNSLAFNTVPWFAIAQEDVQTGGYGPEYGFSTGGVVSVNTKQGTNTWQGGVDYQVTPDAWQGHTPARYDNAGRLVSSSRTNSTSKDAYSAWIGGPLIKDKLFFFGAAQFTRTKDNNYSSYSPSSLLPAAGYTTPINAGAGKSRTSAPYYLGRLDWNITDNNTATYTFVSDVSHEATRVYDLTYRNGDPHAGAWDGTLNYKQGGKVNILKDVWQITDGLTLTAIYGQSKYYNPNEGNPQSAFTANGVNETYNGVLGDANQPGCPVITDQRGSVLAGTVAPIQGCNVAGNLSTGNAIDRRKSGTLNLEYVIGNHDIVLGGSKESFTSKGGSTTEGGAEYDYYSTDAGQDYAEQVIEQTSASVGIHTTSAYLKDSWTIADNWLFNYGLRYDKFSNYNGTGDTYIKMAHIWQPRLGLSWDVHGDSSLKLYASAGRYALPVDSGVALRSGSPSIYTYQDFSYSGVDPTTGRPLNLGSPPPGAAYATAYPINGESGVAPLPGSYSNKSLKPYTQDEYRLGAQQALDDGWILGLELTHRRLKTAIDDFCDWRPFAAWGAAHGYGAAMDAAGTGVNGGYPPLDQGGCFLFNPGSGGTWNVDLTGNGVATPVHLSAAEIGSPKAKRTYNAATFTFERQWDNVWYLKGSYVWSQSRGNTEGMVATDVGPGQADAGTTEAFDYPELMRGANGYLPNDHRHVINVFGAWKFLPEWQLGLTVNIASGAPISCQGYLGSLPGEADVSAYIGYANGFHVCNGEISQRGTSGRTPWTYVLSPNVSYMPHWAKGLTFRAGATNLLNNVKPLTVYETSETGGGGAGVTGVTPYRLYKVGRTYETPRVFQLEAEYDFSL
ncbi:TonB-dependent receptor [Frateuria defendens]|uniref:TonB-dependent receptor n=1 Tax=Frateuria defendens TaxID=2219559 RepID=UPI0009E4CC48|nr:TonB-dependent receptor [Frateuria defendens]